MRQHSAVNSLIFMHDGSMIVCLGPLPLYIIYIIISIFHNSNILVSINRINLLLLGSLSTCLKIQSKCFAAALRCSGDMKHDPRIVITLYRVPLIFLIRSSTGMHHAFAPGIHVRGPNSFRKIFSGFCVCICAPEIHPPAHPPTCPPTHPPSRPSVQPATHLWTNERTHERTARWTNGRKGEWPASQPAGQLADRPDKQTNARTDGRTEGQTDRKTDERTEV